MEKLQELQEAVEVLEENVKSIKKQLKELAKPKKIGRQRVDCYYCITPYGNIEPTNDTDYAPDMFNFSIGNYFSTKAEAEQYKQNLLITQQLKDIALELNDGEEINWDDEDFQDKYYICYNLWDDTFGMTFASRTKISTIYCLSNKFLKVAKDRVGEDRLKEYFKSL